MGMTIGATTKVAVSNAAPAEWANTYAHPVEIRLASDVPFHVAIGDHGDVAATDSDMYVSIYEDACLSVGVGQDLSFLGADTTAGTVWVTEVKKS
jgi:hypothetical protein